LTLARAKESCFYHKPIKESPIKAFFGPAFSSAIVNGILYVGARDSYLYSLGTLQPRVSEGFHISLLLVTACIVVVAVVIVLIVFALKRK
jgi:hypothetical protein